MAFSRVVSTSRPFQTQADAVENQQLLLDPAEPALDPVEPALDSVESVLNPVEPLANLVMKPIEFLIESAHIGERVAGSAMALHPSCAAIRAP
jgi:hypothetical protein